METLAAASAVLLGVVLILVNLRLAAAGRQKPDIAGGWIIFSILLVLTAVFSGKARLAAGCLCLIFLAASMMRLTMVLSDLIDKNHELALLVSLQAAEKGETQQKKERDGQRCEKDIICNQHAGDGGRGDSAYGASGPSCAGGGTDIPLCPDRTGGDGS